MERNIDKTKWRWGVNSFIKPEELTTTLPSYCDPTVGTPTSRKTGPVKDGIEFNGTKSVFSITPGDYGIYQYQNIVWPSESIHVFMEDGTTLVLPTVVDTSLKPRLSTYKYNESMVIIPNREYIYSPGASFASGGYRFKFINNNTEVEVNTAITTAVTGLVINEYDTSISGKHAFVLPEFPAYDINAGAPAGLSIDGQKGIIYTNDTVTTVTVTYTPSALLSYLPKAALTNNVLYPDATLEQEKFANLSLTPNFRI